MKKNKLIETNEVTPEIKKSLRARIITAVIMLSVLVPCVFVGSLAYAIVGVFLAVAVGFEIVHASKPSKRFRIPIYILTIFLILSYVFWIFLKNNLTDLFNNQHTFDSIWTIFNTNFNDIYISIIALIVSALFYFMFSFLDDDTTISNVMYYIAMAAICGVSIQALMYLRYAPFSAFSAEGSIYKDTVDVNSPIFQYLQSPLLLVYVLLGVIFNDTGAYFVGILFGKHRVNPRISPKKTWEGFAGGIVFSFILSAGFALILAACNFPIFPYLDLSHFYYILIISAFVPIVADLGDFVFSAIKRHFGIKDFSNILPGHGGVLDRFDSIFFCSVTVACFLVMVSGGWKFGIV